ncbi:MAG: cupin domain-containing protein [Planctomycetaceae bacterium]|nr:cupin domain-containing protein [Planctomycetaceae bacterium]
MIRQISIQNSSAIRNRIISNAIAGKAAININQQNSSTLTRQPRDFLDKIFSPDKCGKGKTHEGILAPPKGIVKRAVIETTTSYDGTLYSYPTGQAKFSLLEITIPPRTTLGSHSHPMPNIGYVVSGSITLVNDANQERKTYFAGQAIPEMVNTRHHAETYEQCVLLVFYAGVKGQALSEPSNFTKSDNDSQK